MRPWAYTAVIWLHQHAARRNGVCSGAPVHKNASSANRLFTYWVLREWGHGTSALVNGFSAGLPMLSDRRERSPMGTDEALSRSYNHRPAPAADTHTAPLRVETIA